MYLYVVIESNVRVMWIVGLSAGKICICYVAIESIFRVMWNIIIIAHLKGDFHEGNSTANSPVKCI